MTTAPPIALSDMRLSVEGMIAVLTAIGLKPTAGPEGQENVLRKLRRFILVAGGERGGKSYNSAQVAIVKILEHIALAAREGRLADIQGDIVWLVGENYGLTQSEFDLIADAFALLGMKGRSTKRVDPGYINIHIGEGLKPIVVKTKSAAEPEQLRAEAPIGVIMCEAALMSFDAYERLRGRVAEKRGWILLSGTFEGSLGWYPSLYTRWKAPAFQEQEDAISVSLPSHGNTYVYSGPDDPELVSLRESLSEDAYKERHLAIPAPPSGLVHRDFRFDVHCRWIKYQKDQPVWLAIDPGYSTMRESAYAVEACHIIDGQIQVFDEIYLRDHVHSEVVRVAQAKWWWANPQKYGWIDIAGGAHAGAGESAVEVWGRDAGLHLRSERVKLHDGIERMDSLLKPHPITGEPGIVFHYKTCPGVISELGGCPNPFDGQLRAYQWQEGRTGQTVGRVPRDRYNHGIKALTYLAVGRLGYASAKPRTGRNRLTRHRSAAHA